MVNLSIFLGVQHSNDNDNGMDIIIYVMIINIENTHVCGFRPCCIFFALHLAENVS